MSIDERLEALTMNLELQAREGESQRQSIHELRLSIQELKNLIEMDAQNIRSLARVAEAHERRLDHIEGV